MNTETNKSLTVEEAANQAFMDSYMDHDVHGTWNLQKERVN